ncbi:Nif11-like leader peptide family RiPP precursor [Methylobacterium sp. J-078]|uniref:Nif11-like leader peptide family RiPP precursor n=1 Tax=Methylobacterium sp. J-078 TaxID=2836657 RepID=UPI001FBA0799|nr:Nif11-like leader peptide family RiPP precursor [Methylobacterium sp. J-078]MCJ2045952.1 Nif11-like leader peptide family RiPP precursor [Methylobacterium sp. J-078]
MSISELDRFSTDLKADTALQEQFAGSGKDLGALVEAAQAKGYDFTVDDVQARIAEHDSQLSEEELNTVAGGRPSSFTIIIRSGDNMVYVHW